LRIGELHYRREGEIHYLAMNRGFAEVTPAKTTILADTAEPAEEIDIERAKSARARAEERLRTLSKDDPAYPQAMEALERAKVRIRVAEKTIHD
jgi:F-type H+-transporting ATPase subunit epsilon